ALRAGARRCRHPGLQRGAGPPAERGHALRLPGHLNTFSDAQCGFKAVKRSVAQQRLPEVENNEWFLDTDLLLLAEERGMRIYEVPVDWIEDLDSRVRIVSTATEDIKGLLRVRIGRRLRG